MYTRELIKSGQIKEGVKVTIKEGARLPYRAAGGHWGANYAKSDFQATVTKAYCSEEAVGAYDRPYISSSVHVIDENGREFEVECGICPYSRIDYNGRVTILQNN